MNTEFSCVQCRDALPEYVAGTLPLVISTVVANHLAHCVACQHELAAWRSIMIMARRIEERVPSGDSAQVVALWQTIQAQLLSESATVPGDEFMNFDHADTDTDLVVSTGPVNATRAQRQRRPRVVILAPVAALLLVALMAGVFALHPIRNGTSVAAPPTNTITAPPHSPTPTLTDFTVTHVAILASNNIWASGDRVSTFAANPMNDTYVGGLLHYNGSAWQADPTVYQDAQLNGVSLDSPSDGWAVGTQSKGPLLLHYGNGRWAQVPFSYPALELTWVQMLSPDAGWALGAMSTNLSSVVLHYTKGKWTPVEIVSPPSTAALYLPASTAGAAQNAAPLSLRHPASSTNPNLPLISQIQMVSDSEGWAIGWYHNQNVLWHYLNGHWSITDYYPSSNADSFITIGANAPNDVWLLVDNPNAGGEIFKHYDGQVWTTQQVNASAYATFIGNARWLPVTVVNKSKYASHVSEVLLNQGGQWNSTNLPNTTSNIIGITPLTDGTSIAVADVPTTSALSILRYANDAWSAIG